jgi:hypothetical protein
VTTSRILAGFVRVPKSRMSLHVTPSGLALGTNLGTVFYLTSERRWTPPEGRAETGGAF